MNTEPSVHHLPYEAALDSAVMISNSIAKEIPEWWHSKLKRVLDEHVAKLMEIYPRRPMNAKWDNIPLNQAHHGIRLVVNNETRMS